MQAHQKEIHSKDKVPAFRSTEAKNFDTCPPNGTIGNKTVRQLLEERQTFIKKLTQNELELIGRLNTKGQIDKNVQAQFGNKTSLNIPEMIQIEKSPTLNKQNIAMTGVVPYSPRSSDFINNQRSMINQVYSSGFGYTIAPPKKNPTVRQLLERYRKSHKNNNQSPGEMKLSKINRRNHPYQDKSSRLLPSNVSKNNLKKMLDIIGSDPNNPIVLSGDESDDCSVISYDSSSIRTEHSISSESSQRLSDSYNLYSEHNYVMSPELTLQANQVIIDLNRHLSADPPKESSIEQDQYLSSLTEQNKVEMLLNLDKNHRNHSEDIFFKSLNLINSKDMRRKPIAYLNAKYPLNQISRSIYAGIDTKRAVLDFPKPKHQVYMKNLFESHSKHKILDKSHETVSDKRVSNNWSEVLENLDFSSPLSQKIIGVVPKYQLNRLIN